MKKRIQIKKIEDIRVIGQLLDGINNLHIQISDIKGQEYKFIMKENFNKLVDDLEEWMSFDRIKLYSGKNLIFQAILHEFEFYTYDNRIYDKIIIYLNQSQNAK